MNAKLDVVKNTIENTRSSMLVNSEFYKRLKMNTKPEDFTWCASLYHLSKEFIEALRLRNDRFQNVDHDVFADHYEEEKEHARMLRKWMIDNGMPDPETIEPTKETREFINMLYVACVILDNNLSLLVTNSTAEGFAFDLYNQVYPHLLALGNFGDLEYWQVHTVADEEHSDVYHYLSEMSDEELKQADYYVRYTLDVIERMIASWK